MYKSLTIVAPSNTMKHLNPHLRSYGEKQLGDMGFKITYGKYIDHCFLNMAGKAEERVEDLISALLDPHTDGVIAVYGGYNTNQLLPLIYSNEIFKNSLMDKKFLIGYSDITALLLFLSQKTSLKCYHGPGFASFCDPAFFEYTKENFQKAISGEAFAVCDPCLSSDDLWYRKKNYGPREIQRQSFWKTYQAGYVCAPIVGGNLETICALAGTIYFPCFNNKILFVEDAVGNVGSVHRNMTQLEQMGVLDNIAGLIIGKFPSVSDLNNDVLLFSLLKDILKQRNYPVLCHVHCSHVDPMITIPLEKNCLLEAKKTEPFIILNA